MTVASAAPPRACEPAPADRRYAWLVGVAVGVVLVVGVALRFYSSGELWLDEALGVNIAKLPLGDLRAALERDGAPPLYYVLLHGWIALFGDSTMAVRTLSGVISVATLPLAFLAGRQVGGRPLAWVTLLVVAASPHAIRYSTEARMYGLEMLLVFAAYLVLRAVLDRPNVAKATALAALTAALLYNQYWSNYLVAVVGLGLVVASVRDAPIRRAARFALGGVVVGCLAFVPWLPTFLSQAAHTGTPWGEVYLPTAGWGLAVQDFAGSRFAIGWALAAFVVVLPLLGAFGRAVDRRHIDLDLVTVPELRWEAAAAAGAFGLGLTASWLAQNTFEGRYAAVVFPFFALLAARGVLVFTDERVRIAILAIVCTTGLVAGAQHGNEARTQAPMSAAIIRTEAQPGDVVVYCPDQLGPDVSRLVDRDNLVQLTYPDGDPPEFVNWVDYADRISRTGANAFAEKVLAEAGDHDIWYVSASAYRNLGSRCEELSGAFSAARPAQVKVAEQQAFFEYQALTLFPAP